MERRVFGLVNGGLPHIYADSMWDPPYLHVHSTWDQDVVYDDFIPKFDGSKFNASEWVELFAEAGAKYFVLVTVCQFHSSFPTANTGSDYVTCRNITMDFPSSTPKIQRIEVVFTLVRNGTSFENYSTLRRMNSLPYIVEPITLYQNGEQSMFRLILTTLQLTCESSGLILMQVLMGLGLGRVILRGTPITAQKLNRTPGV
jgi:hypothetical protein